MHIVINVPEKVYNHFCRGCRFFDEVEEAIIAITDGTPIPKGHGKLIDVKDLLEEICLEDTKENRKINLGEIITLEDIDRIEPIIEAEGSEKE